MQKSPVRSKVVGHLIFSFHLLLSSQCVDVFRMLVSSSSDKKKHTTLWLDIYLYNSCINNWVWWISAVRICVLCHFFAARATIFGRSIWTSLYVNFEENRLIDIANWSKSKIDRTHPVILSSGYDKSIWRFIFHVNSFFLCHSFPF